MNYLWQRVFVVLFIFRLFVVDFFINAGSEEQSLCIVCLDAFDNINVLNCSLKCGHRFHSLCIQKWFEEKGYKSCPLCMKFDSPEDGVDALIDTCKKLNLDLLKIYIAMGADVNGKNKAGNTPLHAACLIVNDEIRFYIIACLLNSGVCNFEIQNHNGFTALMLLAFTNKIDSILQIVNYCLGKKHDLQYCLSGVQLQSIVELVLPESKDYISGCVARYKQELRNYYE